MRVVFLITSLEAGGLETYLLRFLQYTEGMFEPVVWCKSGQYGNLYPQYQKIRNIQIIARSIGNFSIKSQISYFLEIHKCKPDVLCDFTGDFAGIPLFLARISGVRTRISFYRGSVNRFHESFFKLMYARMVRRLTVMSATDILSNSKAAFDFFYPGKWLTDKRFQIIRNGIDINTFKTNRKLLHRADFGIPENAFVVGHTGRVHWAKNHKVILEIAEQLTDTYPDIYFILCGKDTDTFVTEAKKNGLKNVIGIGYRSDIADILSLFDVFLFPSITEGQPNSLIEALVSGLPVIASNIPPILETLPDELHSELLLPEDVQGFVAKLKSAYINRQNSDKKIQEWAVQQYDASVCFDKFLKVLQK
jgi:glycosyltransferase involved in cell wall biosynthesis